MDGKSVGKIALLAAVIAVAAGVAHGDVESGTQPPVVTIPVTRVWGPLSANSASGTSAGFWLERDGSSIIGRKVLLGSDDGETAVIRISPDTRAVHEPPPGFVAARASVGQAPAAGAYSREVPLATDTVARFRLLVQDFVLWPIWLS